jgi:hypothetical protein
MLGYNDEWRHHRRMMNNWLNTRAATQFHKLQEHQTRSFLQRLLGMLTYDQPFDGVKDEIFL